MDKAFLVSTCEAREKFHLYNYYIKKGAFLIKIFKTLLLIGLVFIIGFTYNEYRHRDEGTDVVEFFIDGADNVVAYVASFFDDEVGNAYDEINTGYDEADVLDSEVATVDNENKVKDGEKNNKLNVAKSKVIDFIDSITPNSPETKFVEPTSYKPMITYEDINYPSEPKTVEDFEKVFLYMVNQGILELELYYSKPQEDESVFENRSTAFHNTTQKYIELFSNIDSANYETTATPFSSTLKIKIGNTLVDDITLLSHEQYFQKRAGQINDALHEKNFITDDMTQKEVAKELFRYVTRTLKYDTDFNQESYTGYGAVKNNFAVCQGYTALYNYLLKLNGIDCIGQDGEILENGGPHIWTVATLDGKTSYIDVTFGDPVPDKAGYTDYEYFNVSKEFLSQDRTGVK